MTAVLDVVQFAGKTDVGMRRPNNQDSLLASPASSEKDWQTRGHVFIVADGMGAHAVGELASQLAAKTIVHTYRKLQHLDRWTPLKKPSPKRIARFTSEAGPIRTFRAWARPLLPWS